MKLELPLYLMTLVHSSMDKRIKEREDIAQKDPNFKLAYDDLYPILKNIRSAIERQAPEGTKFRRVYTGGE